jgi:hypothetical protein
MHNAAKRGGYRDERMNDSQGHSDVDRRVPDFLAGGGELGALMRAYDWSATPLGPPETWPRSLKTALRIMLTSRQPIWIGWGRELTYFYNDAYKSIIGGKHPRALGRPTSEVWREIWTDIGPMLETAMGGVEGTYVEEQLLIMERNGYPEETYYTFSYSPIPDDNGVPGGIHLRQHRGHATGHRRAPARAAQGTGGAHHRSAQPARCLRPGVRRARHQPARSALCHDLYGRARP